MDKGIRQHRAFGPGEHIREEIEARGWSEGEFADILGISEKHLSEILNDKTPMTIPLARLIGKAFGTTPQVWMNLYINYIEDKGFLEKKKEHILDDVGIRSEIYMIMPVNDMVKKGWIPPRCSSAELLNCVKKMWGTDVIKNIIKEIDAKPLPSFRKTEKDGFSRNYSQTWLKIAENIADRVKVPAYKPAIFAKICDLANEYTVKKDGVGEFLEDIRKAGVKFFVLPHLKKTYIDGAAFMDGKNPVIVYTGRYDRVDNFWFTMLHEAGHVLKHLKSGNAKFIDDLSDLVGKQEEEADMFSSEKLKIGQILRRFDEDFNNRLSWIISVSKELHVSSAVVVGALQKAEKLTYRSRVLSEIKEQVSNKIKGSYVPDVSGICHYEQGAKSQRDMVKNGEEI